MPARAIVFLCVHILNFFGPWKIFRKLTVIAGSSGDRKGCMLVSVRYDVAARSKYCTAEGRKGR